MRTLPFGTLCPCRRDQTPRSQLWHTKAGGGIQGAHSGDQWHHIALGACFPPLGSPLHLPNEQFTPAPEFLSLPLPSIAQCPVIMTGVTYGLSLCPGQILLAPSIRYAHYFNWMHYGLVCSEGMPCNASSPCSSYTICPHQTPDAVGFPPS